MTVLDVRIKSLFNRMGGLASKYKLGDLLEDALIVDTADIRNAGITLEKMAADSVDTDNLVDGAITRAKMSPNMEAYTTETFVDPIMQSGGASGAPSGTAGDVNYFRTMQNNVFQWNVKGTQTLTGLAWAEGLGIDINQDQTENDGIEITQGIAATSVIGKKIDTHNFSFKAKLTVADVSGTDELVIGLRKAEAYQGASATYTDQAAIKVNNTAIGIQTNLNTAGAALTNTTDVIADTEALEVKITVGNEARLQTAMKLANALKVTYNAHLNDGATAGTEHATGKQAAITAANATNYSTLITLITEMMASYVIHEADAVLEAAWAYHIAATSDDDSLTSELAPTTLALAVTRLNDLKAKLNLHMADATAHTNGDSAAETVIDACNTMFQIGVDDAALALPTVSKSFNFDTTDIVVPFVFLLNHTAPAGTVYLSEWIVEPTTTVVA